MGTITFPGGFQARNVTYFAVFLISVPGAGFYVLYPLVTHRLPDTNLGEISVLPFSSPTAQFRQTDGLLPHVE